MVNQELEKSQSILKVIVNLDLDIYTCVMTKFHILKILAFPSTQLLSAFPKTWKVSAPEIRSLTGS